MSGKRIFGLLSIVFGSFLVLLGIFAVLNAVRFTIAQPLVIGVGVVLVVLGAVALKTAPPIPQPSSQPGAVPNDGARANPAGAVIGLLVLGFFGEYFGGGLENETNRRMQDIHNQVAADAVAQYGIAQRNGSPIDVCVQAGFVAAAYLQAKDEANYQRWKQTEKTDCAKAGIDK